MKTWVWLSICFACFSWGVCFGIWLGYRQHKKSMRELATEAERQMDLLAEGFKKTLDRAYQDMGINIQVGGTQ